MKKLVTDKILITGVAGFIGSKLAVKFISEGFKVVGVDDLSSGNKGNIPKDVEFILGDLSKQSTIEKIPSGCNKILHLAGQSSGEISFDNPVSDLQKNTISTLNLIHYGIRNKSERIVYASSMSVYGSVEDGPIIESQRCEPLSCYGVGKLAAEGYLRVFEDQIPFVSLRMFNVYGPGQDMQNLRQGMVSIFTAQALQNKNIQVKGGLGRFRDLIYIDDVIDAWFSAAINNEALGKAINVGTGVKTTVKTLLEKICSRVHESSYYVQGSTPGDQNGIYADSSRMKTILNINNCTNIDEGLDKLLNWILCNKVDMEQL